MQVHLRTRIGSVLLRPYPLYSLFHPLRVSPSSCHRTLTSTVNMVAESSTSKRPMCSKCSKPARVCLCTRLKTPCHENSVAVTILQHSLEKKHPLNSTRIASLGLRNVSVVSVSDVNFQARFVVRSLDPDEEMGSSYLDEKSSDFGAFGSSKRKWNSLGDSISCSGLVESSDFQEFSECPIEKKKLFVDSDEEFSERANFCSATCREFSKGDLEVVQRSLDGADSEEVPKCCTSGEAISAVSGRSEDDVVSFTMEKYGAISSITNHGLPKDQFQKCISSITNHGIPKDQFQKRDHVDQLLSSKLAVNGSGKGFSVRKFQRKQWHGNADHEEFEEFEIKVPPGSVLLFPSEKSVGIEAMDIKVTNVVVLDGTWAKARRMYSENPWLKLLPHLRLDLADVSLYREVRHQPRAGCLSTIESIVYALKALGEDSERLDGLLEVFKSMVGDQRRCKNERLNQVSAKPPDC